MPVKLKIVIGLIVIAIISQLYSIAKFTGINNPGSYAMHILWIIVWIAIIRGFLNRSNISRRLAIGITLIGLLGSLYAFYIFMAVPFSRQEDQKIAIILSCSAILIQGYTIFALTSKKVIAYFMADKGKNAQQPARADAGSNAAI